MKLLTTTLLLLTLTISISAQPRSSCSKGQLLKCLISKLPKPVKIIIIKTK